MAINFFIETIVPIIIAIISLIFQLLDRYKPNDFPKVFSTETTNTSVKNRKTVAKWLYQFIVIITYSALVFHVFLKIQTTSRLLIDDKTGFPTADKILSILGTSIQDVQHYLLYLIIGLLFSMLITEFIQKKLER